MLRIGPPNLPPGAIPLLPQGGAPPMPTGSPANSGEDQDATGQPTNSKSDKLEPKFDIDKVPPQNAGYMGSENGPFECEHCKFFSAPSSCHIVAGKIDPEGCCNMFTPGGAPDDDEDGEDSQGRGPQDASAAPDLGTPEESV